MTTITWTRTFRILYHLDANNLHFSVSIQNYSRRRKIKRVQIGSAYRYKVSDSHHSKENQFLCFAISYGEDLSIMNSKAKLLLSVFWYPRMFAKRLSRGTQLQKSKIERVRTARTRRAFTIDFCDTGH